MGCMIEKDRVESLNREDIKKRQYILYWMQASQRTEYNHALEYAIVKANKTNMPVVVYFGLTDDLPAANERHYHFMLEGLREIESSLEEKRIRMIVRHESPHVGVVELSKKASLIVVDRGYLRTQKKWRRYVAHSIKCPLVQVESDVVIPVRIASPKEEYSAATFRPKINKKLDYFLRTLKTNYPKVESLKLNFDSIDINDPEKVISNLDVNKNVKKVKDFHGGTTEAKRHLENFLRDKLECYEELRNDFTKEFASNMSPYLHFGQISPLYIVLKVMETDSPGKDAYLEQLIVRRELSMNFVFYNKNYDSFDGLPEWAKKTLKYHEKDLRKYTYVLEELENAETHDPYWNAAQREMTSRGKMHSYMRMYWGKKIIEWSRTPEEAYKTVIYLNNKYELDGRDPNGFTGVAWCFGKHDRPWKERQIFGKIRYMNANGLKRKFDADVYVAKIL
jgi:deoxyribodipyrimidine photo-lyase